MLGGNGSWTAAQNQKSGTGPLIGRTNSLPPAEEDAVDLEPQEVRVGVPPARRRDRGLQRDRRVELRHEPPRVLGLGRGGYYARRPGAGAARSGARGSGGGERGERSRGRHRHRDRGRRPAGEYDR